MAKVYIIRTQGCGFLFDKVYANPPSKDDVKAALKRELFLHGVDPKTGEPRPRWARVVAIEFDEGKSDDPAPGETTYQLDAETLEAARRAAAEPKVGKADSAMIQMTGEGRVIPPGDPEHPSNAGKS